MGTDTILHVFRLYHEQKNFLVNFSHKTFTRKSNKGDFYGVLELSSEVFRQNHH